MKKRKILRERRKRARIVPLVLALVMVVTMVNPSYVNASDGANESSGGFFSNAIEAVADFFGIGDETETAEDGVQTFAVEDATSTVDPDTTNDWTQYTRPGGQPSTQNVGRIWTDKSVFDGDYTFEGDILAGQKVEKGDSDFLVGLSALSSTSNLKTTTYTSQPLDIVLVLDDSGSMAYGIDSDVQEQEVITAIPADQVVESHGHIEDDWFGDHARQDTYGGEYYAQIDGEYVRIYEDTTEVEGDWWTSYQEHVRWTLNGQEVNPETTQFYTRTVYDLSTRRGALQYAVNNFIDQTAAMNAQITDENNKIRLSIVVFEDNASVENSLTVCEGANIAALKDTVNNLRANGATNAGAGMSNANNELVQNSTRDNTKQVVIFFTDGVPTTSNNFSSSVANTAVSAAGDIKGRGGSIYSVGIFDGADPSQTEVPDRGDTDTDRANVFMNAVSSNYPNASQWDNLGDRATGDPDFYKSAANAGDLNEVFQDIFDESTENAGSGSPIVDNSAEGNTNPGDLAFTDTLGSYMEVTSVVTGDDKMYVAYADQLKASDSRTEQRDEDNGVTTYTYHFSGRIEGNAVYGEADLADLEVTVTHYDDPAKGDVVTANIPADLLPLRNYDVDTNENKMTVTPAYPIRLFYGVSLKQDAIDAIASGTGDIYNGIVATNKSADGRSAEFLTNQWTKGSATGDTMAVFTPNAGNKFYYYTSDTPLYIDEACTQRATRENIDSYNPLYYSEPYWVQDDSTGAAHQVTTGIAIDQTGQDWNSITYQNGLAYIPAGTQRLDRPATLNSGKTDNKTATADSVLTPQWEGAGVSQHLGNNGKVTIPLPGQLEIKKSVDWGNASDETKANQNSFKFTVNFNGDEVLAGVYSYDVYKQGTELVKTDEIADGGTVTLEAGQRAVISGLPDNTTFTVTETGANENGFVTTDQVSTVDNNPNDGVANGTILGGSQQSVTFQNNYNADEPLNVDMSTYLNVEKVLTGRDWRASDQFIFEVQSVDIGSGVCAPKQDRVTITDSTENHKSSFGNITFIKTGTFRYIVNEVNDENAIIGIDYSSASYRLDITVVDAGNGTMKVDSYKLERLQNDEGSMQGGVTEDVQGDTVTFTNKYLTDGTGTTNIDGYKNYTDKSGDNIISNNKFQFQMEALGGYITETGSRDILTISADDTPKPTVNTQGNVTTIGNTGNSFNMPAISFDGNDVGKTYVYKITEVQGTEVGMTYDKSSYEVEIKVTEEIDADAIDGQDRVHIVATPNKTPRDLTFTNTYEPTAAIIEAGSNAIHGTKTLQGRAMQQGEVFYFQLTALNDNAKTVLPNSKTVQVDDPTAMSFDFGDMSFSMVGTYTFQVNEVADENGTKPTNGNGMAFDTNLCTVTVEVTDNKQGALVASVSYLNDMHINVIDHAQFTNVYKATMNYGAAGGINVTKTMVDRSMTSGDFDFTLTGSDPDGQVNEQFSNSNAAPNQTVKMPQLQNLTFDQDDAGKTFSFTVDEVEPVEDDKLTGVEYDQSEYLVSITVYDNYNGTMHTETTVTRIKNAAGNSVNEVVVNAANSDGDGYEVPTFGFTNTYEPTEATLAGESALQVTKTVEGAPSPDGVEYSFTLTAQNTAEGPVANIGGLTDGKLTAHTTGVINQDGVDNTGDESQTVSFGTLTFSKPGRYTFSVVEDAPAADPGWSYDTTAKTVTVVVSDRNEEGQYDGALHIANVTGNPVQVTNSYKSGSVVVGGDGAQQQITVQKSVTGADSAADFSFQLAPVDLTDDKWNNVEAVERPYDSLATIADGVTQAQSKTATFAGIQFNAAGEYQFTITEVQPESVPNGWTYDNHTATVTVKVTDNDYDGYLEAEVIYDNSEATRQADKDCTTAAAFTNSYQPNEITTGDDAETGILVTKEVTGAPATEAFTFSLNLADGQDGSNVFEGTGDDKIAFDGVEVTTSDNIAAGARETKAFAGVTFTAAGDYRFVIDETTTTDKKGWTYDDNTVEITVHVVDQNGQLVITGINNNNQTFVNSYVPGSVTVGGDETGLRATKQVTGAPATEEFEFTLRLTSDNAANVQGLNENNSITKSTTGLTGKEDATETIDFGDLTFSAEGIYTFTVTENNTTDADGWTYGTGSGAVITVTVTDEGHDGQLDATTIVEVNGEQVDTNNPTIVNSYDPGSVTIGDGEAAGPIQVTKNIEGTAPAAEDFSFTLTFTPDAEGNTGKAENIQGLTNNSLMTSVSRESLLEDNTETAAFGKLTFTEEGDYYFTVTENNQAAENSGWTYDNSPKTVIVHVTDTDHNGHLEASVDDDAAVITNSYVPGSVTVGGDETGLQVTKQVTGAPALSEFAFTLQLTSDNAANVEGLGEGNAITESTTGLTGKEDSETVDFGELTFTAVGDYVFTVKEDTEKPADADGWTYDNSSYTITVHVTDENYDGQLDATVEGNNPTVTNQYKANEVVIGGDSGNTGIAVQKTLFGRNWQEGDSFSFTLAAADGTPMPVEGEEIVTISNEDTEKTAEFGAITYTETGTYHYTVTEAGGNIGGVTYDKHIANVTVNVTDENYDGQLDAEVTYDNNTEGVYEDDADVTTIAAFTNTYEPGGTVNPGTGDAKAQLTKELVGRDWMEGDQFSFTITADEDTPAETLPAETTVTVGKPESGNSNTFDFGPFTFNAEGEYHYTVREEGAGTTVNGITYSTNEAHITINVTDNLQGGFAASVTIANATFTNTYSAGLDYGAEGGLNLVKRLDGHDIAAGQFQFQVTPVSGDGYVSAEDAAKKAGIEESGLTVSTDAASMVDGVAVDSIALFNQMKFDQTDNGKTYAYQISEVQETKAGYQYDKTTYTVTISVSDDNNGVLTVTTVVSNGTDSTAYVYTSEDGQNTPAQVVFNNAYDGSGSLGGEGAVSIQADKELLNGQLSGNDFTFIVTDKNEAEVTRGTNDASGKITFNEVAYTTDKLIADLASGAASYDADSSTYAYQYEVTEDTSNFQDMGVIANVAHFNITVTVKDNGDGTLTTAVDYGQYGDGLTFQNTYGTGADIAVNVGGTKELAHADGLTPPDITGAYQFTISGQDENGNAAPLPANTTASNDANGNVSFGTIQYTMENVFGTTAGEAASDDAAAGEDGIDTQIAQRTKTYTYTVTESGTVAGVTNDPEASKTFTIVVTDNGDGTLSVTDGAGNTVVPGAQFTFVNTYSVTPSTSTPTGDGGITITKNLEGRALNEGEFTFEMTGLAGTISEGMAVTGTNDAAGNVALGGLEFSRPGTYEFRISEVIPETPAGGVTYDGMTYQATAEVTDNHDGTLAVAWTVKAAADGEALKQVTFTNTYKAAPAGVQFGALKRLDGDARDLKAGEFTFQVKDESGKVVATAKNKADGSVRFDSITFDKAGTYTYTISEVKGSDETITYDETVYTAIVNVTDDLNGQLYASVTAEDGSALKMTFTNKYTKPAVPVEPDEGPTAVRTGDTAPILPIILVMAAALAAIIAAAAVILRRNRRQ